RRSFGKGAVQSVVKLGDGSGLKLTVGRYYTPNGRSIQSEGIVPDVELKELDAEAFKKSIVQKEVRRERNLKGHLLGEKERKQKSKKKSVEFWWAKSDEKSDDRPKTPKEKLLEDDFDLQQAYSYLKAFKTLSSARSL